MPLSPATRDALAEMVPDLEAAAVGHGGFTIGHDDAFTAEHAKALLAAVRAALPRPSPPRSPNWGHWGKEPGT